MKNIFRTPEACPFTLRRVCFQNPLNALYVDVYFLVTVKFISYTVFLFNSWTHFGSLSDFVGEKFYRISIFYFNFVFQTKCKIMAWEIYFSNTCSLLILVGSADRLIELHLVSIFQYEEILLSSNCCWPNWDLWRVPWGYVAQGFSHESQSLR